MTSMCLIKIKNRIQNIRRNFNLIFFWCYKQWFTKCYPAQINCEQIERERTTTRNDTSLHKRAECFGLNCIPKSWQSRSIAVFSSCVADVWNGVNSIRFFFVTFRSSRKLLILIERNVHILFATCKTGKMAAQCRHTIDIETYFTPS